VAGHGVAIIEADTVVEAVEAVEFADAELDMVDVWVARRTQLSVVDVMVTRGPELLSPLQVCSVAPRSKYTAMQDELNAHCEMHWQRNAGRAMSACVELS